MMLTPARRSQGVRGERNSPTASRQRSQQGVQEAHDEPRVQQLFQIAGDVSFARVRARAIVAGSPLLLQLEDLLLKPRQCVGPEKSCRPERHRARSRESRMWLIVGRSWSNVRYWSLTNDARRTRSGRRWVRVRPDSADRTWASFSADPGSEIADPSEERLRQTYFVTKAALIDASQARHAFDV